mgnify:FL=1
MIEYDLKKNNNKKNEKAYGKYYAKPHVSETVDLAALAEQMHTFNSPFSAGTIQGILTDAVVHIKELLLAGKNVKLDNLAIFYIGIRNKEGADSKDDFSVLKNILGVRMRARATGDLRSVNLNLEANLKKYGAKKKKNSGGSSTDPDGSDNTNGGGSGNQTQGGGSENSGSQTGGSGTESGGTGTDQGNVNI